VKKFQKKITYKGRSYNSVYEASKKLNFSYRLALSRLARGETVEDAFFKGKLSSRRFEIKVGKKSYRSLEAARKDINPKLSSRNVNWRYRQNWPIEEVLGIKKHKDKDKEEIKFRGKKYESLSSLARAYNVDPTLFIRRVKSKDYAYKFTHAEALGLKKHSGKGFTQPVVLEGKKYKSLTEAAKKYKLKIKTISERLLKGWSVEQAFELKKRKDYHPGKIGIIYLIKNKITNKYYVGASLGSLKRRWKDHVENKNIKKRSLHEAIKKFGVNNFSRKIIKRCKYLSDLSKYERLYIKKYNSLNPNGYNLSSGGFGMGNLGRKIIVNNKKFNSLRDAANFHKIKPELFIGRLNAGWDIEEAIGLRKRAKIPVNHVSVKIGVKKFKTIREACKFYGLNETTVRNRILNGWDIKKALTTKKIILAKKIKFKGKNFSSIRNLARYYNVSSGTLARKIASGISIKKALGLKS